MWGQANALCFAPRRRRSGQTGDPDGRRGIPLRPRSRSAGSGQASTGRRSSWICRCGPCPRTRSTRWCEASSAYVLSLTFTLVYAFWAAKDRRAETRARPAARHPAEHPGARLHAGRRPGARRPLPADERRPRARGGGDDLHRPGLEHDLQPVPLAEVGPGRLAGGGAASTGSTGGGASRGWSCRSGRPRSRGTA